MGFVLFLINLCLPSLISLASFLSSGLFFQCFFWALKLSQLISGCLAHLSSLHKARHYICPGQCCTTLVALPKFSGNLSLL